MVQTKTSIDKLLLLWLFLIKNLIKYHRRTIIYPGTVPSVNGSWLTEWLKKTATHCIALQLEKTCSQTYTCKWLSSETYMLFLPSNHFLLQLVLLLKIMEVPEPVPTMLEAKGGATDWTSCHFIAGHVRLNIFVCTCLWSGFTKQSKATCVCVQLKETIIP